MRLLRNLLRDHGRKMFAGAWLLAPVAMIGVHFGPGQSAVAQDRVSTAVRFATAAEAKSDWAAAVDAWKAAIGAVPEKDADQRVKLTLKYQQARVMHGELPQALEDTAALLTQAQSAKVSEPVERAVRAELAAMHYWAAWLMRLEGASAEEWEPVCNQARQHFRFLAETETPGEDAQKKNLESTIRLARMDLSELQGLPLPKECKGTKNCTGQCKSQRQGRCQNMSDQKRDAREQVQQEKTKSAGAHNRSNAVGW